jgi:biopolymer transport protein ExbD
VSATPDINVTPLIDVLLVLLIIFMVIQPRKESSFESQVPQKPGAEAPAQAPADLLVIDASEESGPDQRLALNSKSMALVDLGPVLEAALVQRTDKTVFLKAPRGKQYSEVIRVIDVMKGAGAAPIGLQIDYLPTP